LEENSEIEAYPCRLAEPLFQEPPIHRAPQRHPWMLHVDDLIEPRSKQILLAHLSPFPWPHLAD
jgi:hypothetical protein